ncbi:PTS sugar transporter subunit IIA [Caproicibacter fermentans]|uniref:PTS fructose transporter subunit IIA n=1 Tax=Caproicibacter fermentans TaxID=2576756 RepID=A0A7G8T653_9FIRM|nr:PTS fructose transporter subunit IIA [Caproicibacter fermentans]QNK39094.1 PTS fructose transporter subunit IIA [Caproicibacter fermentans]
MKILLVSHGKFAEGLCNTMHRFFGADNIFCAAVTEKDGSAKLRETVENYLAQWEGEQVIICSDMMGGSANQTVYPFLSRPNTFLVAGMNLPLVMQLHLEDGDITADALREMIKDAKTEIVLVNDMDFTQKGEDDE